MKLKLRLLGLSLVVLDPVLAFWAMYVFRNSPDPSDHGYFTLAKGLFREAWTLVKTGEWPE